MQRRPDECTTEIGGITLWHRPLVSVLAVPGFKVPAHMPTHFLGHPKPGDGELLAEFAGRLCYMSHRNVAERTTGEYHHNIMDKGHGSVLEHANYSLLFEGVSRSFTHELVRHRAGFAYSQLSQRYVDEAETSFVIPPAILDLPNFQESPVFYEWFSSVRQARDSYVILVEELLQTIDTSNLTKVEARKKVREAARSVLPNATETKIVVTANARAWRTMLELRASPAAEREIRRCMVEVVGLFYDELAPTFFSDWNVYTHEDGHLAASPRFHKV